MKVSMCMSKYTMRTNKIKSKTTLLEWGLFRFFSLDIFV